MPGIRVDVEWLTHYAGEVGVAGEETVAAHGELEAARLGAEAFGELGRAVGAVDAYDRVTSVLAEQVRRVGESLVGAGDELRRVVDFHAADGEGDVSSLAREQGV